MNKNQVKGAAKASVGKLQHAAGRLVGSRKQEAKGIAKQLIGKAQQQLGDVQEAIKTQKKRDGSERYEVRRAGLLAAARHAARGRRAP
jgi:uncharacterized protein YjbJ (UPF0337 family)